MFLEIYDKSHVSPRRSKPRWVSIWRMFLIFGFQTLREPKTFQDAPEDDALTLHSDFLSPNFYNYPLVPLCNKFKYNESYGFSNLYDSARHTPGVDALTVWATTSLIHSWRRFSCNSSWSRRLLSKVHPVKFYFPRLLRIQPILGSVNWYCHILM